MQLERKFSTLEAETVTDDGVITGYASHFNIIDQGGDIVVPGAYSKSLKERHPRMLWGHDPDHPIGKWNVVKEDEKGLYVEGQIALGTTKGRDVYELIKMGAIEGLSIGYLSAKTGVKDGARLLQEVKLYEISVVAFPMQVEASVESFKDMDFILEASKSGDTVPLKRAVEKAMRDAGFPAWMAKAQAALAPTALGDGSRDASAGEIAKLIRDSFKV